MANFKFVCSDHLVPSCTINIVFIPHQQYCPFYRNASLPVIKEVCGQWMMTFTDHRLYCLSNSIAQLSLANINTQWTGRIHRCSIRTLFLGFQENWQLLVPCLHAFGTVVLPNQVCFPAVQHSRNNQCLNISLRLSEHYFPLRSSASAWHVLWPIASCAVCLPAAAPECWRVNLDSLANMRRGIFWSSLISVAHQLILLWTPKLKDLFLVWEDRNSFFWGSSLLSS